MIVFPPQSAYDVNRCSVAFPVLIDDEQHRCLVTEEALQDHFGANGARAAAEFVATFESHRRAIQVVAENHIRAGVRGEILLKSEHF